nr:amino acid transporter [Actinoplanes sp. TBRC 11911]
MSTETTLRTWLMAEPAEPAPHNATERGRGHPWWKVMCLTGVDYFSTLGYQPGIAALVAGVLSPVATVVLILVTLFGALPVYRRVAVESPHGEGSIAILVRRLTYWRGKLVVLALLGFAATDFMITMTLSTADATEHLDDNPYWPTSLQGHQVIVTLGLLALLGAVFLRGFRAAMGIAVVLVGAYLALNAVVIADGLTVIVTHPRTVAGWGTALISQHGDPFLTAGAALVIFPKLALGLSGFETGVAVMPQIRGDATDTEERPAGRIRGARRLLTTAALVMSGFLLTSSVVTTMLIPPAALQAGGPASGRALAYLAHENLGPVFGTAYDAVTIAILWFAGASALAGLLNLIPRYLPRYGMAPEWARATRPLVLVLTGVAALVTVLFRADVNAQGGAYATGVLVLITSAAAAVTLVQAHHRRRGPTIAFAAITSVFGYTTVVNVVERPDGVKIGGCFIGAILLVSLISRIHRSLDLRVTRVELDPVADGFVRECSRRTLRLIAHEAKTSSEAEYRSLLNRTVQDNDLPDAGDVVFVEVTVADPSDFEDELLVHGIVRHHRYRVLTLESSAVPNALAALLIHIRDRTGHRPHVYFRWSEDNPALNYLRYLFFGHGEVAPVTREILRRHVPDRGLRPHVHAG